jgi:molecular chaperone GrpE
MSEPSASSQSENQKQPNDPGYSETATENEEEIQQDARNSEDQTDDMIDSAIEKDLAEAKDRVLRLQAEFENYRKRMDRERIEIRRRATEHLVQELLPVLDHFEMGLQSIQEAYPEDPTVSGIQLVHKQLMQVLQQAGLEEVSAEGLLFDPNRHEAVGNIPTSEVEEGIVAQQIRKGYLLNDHLLRPASVMVACRPE